MEKQIVYAVTRNGQIDNARLNTFKEAWERGLKISCICFNDPRLVVINNGTVKITDTIIKRKIHKFKTQ